MAQLLLFISFLGTLAFGKTTYSMADLEVLVNQESTEEFFEHVLDIRPSERQETWHGMVSKMADLATRKIQAKSSIEEDDFLKVERLFTLPGMGSDDIFRSRRQAIGIAYLKKCLKAPDPCWDTLKRFWELDKTDVETSYKLAELTSDLQNSPIPAWNFLEVALKSNLSEFYCKKPFVIDALWEKIGLDYIKLGPKGDLMRSIDQTIHPDCLPQLIRTARERLLVPPKVPDRELAFQILKSQTKADEETTDFFLTVYLLDNPSQGELFNYSWNRIRELAGTIGRRERVLEKLKNLDPLPDAIAGSFDEAKKRVVLRHFKTYFPEYLDFYFRQCVSFYRGEGKFPAGNPTIHCQELMNSALAPQLFDDFQIKDFAAARKI